MAKKNLTGADIMIHHTQKIYNMSKTVCKQWHSKEIALTSFKIIIDKAKMKGFKKEFKEVFDNYNKTLDTWYKTAENLCKRTKGTHIPLTTLKVWNDLIIKGIREGAKK